MTGTEVIQKWVKYARNRSYKPAARWPRISMVKVLSPQCGQGLLSRVTQGYIVKYWVHHIVYMVNKCCSVTIIA